MAYTQVFGLVVLFVCFGFGFVFSALLLSVPVLSEGIGKFLSSHGWVRLYHDSRNFLPGEPAAQVS